MKVLFLPGYRYPASLDEPLTCGDLRYSFNLSRALARAGASATVLTRKAVTDPDVHVLDGVTIHRYRPELRRLFSTSFDVSARRMAKFRSLARNADVVIANSPLSLELFSRVGRPIIYVASGLVDVRNYGASARELVQRLAIALLRDPAKRMTWKRAARVNTTAAREDVLLRRLGVPAGRITTIGPGVELERYAPRPPLEVDALRRQFTRTDAIPRRIILSVSRFSPAKGIVETIRAFARLKARRDDVMLLLAGVRHSHRSDYFQHMQRAIIDHQLQGDVIIRENVPEWQLPAYYAAAHVTSVFSVGYDPLPTVIIESMSCGTPVVSTDFETRTQMIEHGESGLVVPERDEQAWVAATERLLDDADLSRRVRDAGLVRVRERFDMNHVAGQYLELMRSL